MDMNTTITVVRFDEYQKVCKERDEQRARAERAETDLALARSQYRDMIDVASRRCSERDERSKEAVAFRKERDDAREQLAKIEWAAVKRVNAGSSLLPACPICEGLQPDEDVRRSFRNMQIGHRPTRWFAKKKTVKLRNHRKDCPARTADDVAWVDSQWQVNGCRTAPIEGPRPNPIGCEGCKCATADDGAAKPPTLREQWKTKQAHYDHWLDAVGYMLLGVDWANGNAVTVTTDRPAQPGAALTYDQASGIWKLVGKPSEPARPEPRFKVGEKVVHERGSGEVCGMFWSQADGWQYQLRSEQPLRIGWPRESSLKPAPKFAVGEWVTHRYGPGEVLSRQWSNGFGCWSYQVTGIMSEVETGLTAQTPQHKQCGAGYVFLGRMTNAIDTDWDLWFVKDGSPFVPGPALASDAGDEFHLASAGDKQTRPELIEARRRAVARGLVKS